MTSPVRLAAMSAAIKDGNAKKVALLLKSGVPADHAGASPAEGSFLELAAIWGQAEIFRMLVAAGADLNEPELLGTVTDARGGEDPICVEIFDLIMDETTRDQDDLDDALRYAASNDNLEVIQRLVDAGANPNGTEDTVFRFPLLNAVEAGRLDVVKQLLSLGADPGANSVRDRDDEGRIMELGSLQDWATQSGVSEEILALLK